MEIFMPPQIAEFTAKMLFFLAAMVLLCLRPNKSFPMDPIKKGITTSYERK